MTDHRWTLVQHVQPDWLLAGAHLLAGISHIFPSGTAEWGCQWLFCHRGSSSFGLGNKMELTGKEILRKKDEAQMETESGSCTISCPVSQF